MTRLTALIIQTSEVDLCAAEQPSGKFSAAILLASNKRPLLSTSDCYASMALAMEAMQSVVDEVRG